MRALGRRLSSPALDRANRDPNAALLRDHLQYFPDAVQILDRFHAKQLLSDVGKAIYGATSDLAKGWARERHNQLDAGEIEALLLALRTHSPANEEARKVIEYIDFTGARIVIHAAAGS